MTDLETQIKQAAELIQQANYVTALTGAGISTPSGIPDFRSPTSGLWQNTNPMVVASIMAFRQHPEKFYEWVRPLAQKITQAKPNAAHHALADLSQQNKLHAIITQNIDGLHQVANSPNVIEVHGHIRTLTCTRCYKTIASATIIQDFLNGQTFPTCDCVQQGTLKPDVILFGEQLPIQALIATKAAVDAADLLIVAGSSLEVAPISNLPSEAFERGTKIIVINYQKTYIDDKAVLTIHHDVTEVLPRIAQLVRAKNITPSS